ncbi:MAG: methylated-DNA--[protein]-cysteine S-methyltransferase [Kiritimatiellae bacterium]|nr:methylated-DNA--[protein]-cysteine S-methyltransferase [Kiritimatiellia bacterium]
MATRIRQTALGRIGIEVGQGHIRRLFFASATESARDGSDDDGDAALLKEAFRQLDAYLDRRLRDFDLPLAPAGTPFQQKVWSALRKIPYGRTASYKEVAVATGHPGAARAVGGANGRNPIAILIPCHRVINADGALGGYSSGLEFKRRLLALERGGALTPPATADARASR